MPGERLDKWRRDAGAPFDDLAREDYAKARAKGATIKAASQVAGVDYEKTARAWERHPDMLARVRELRSGAETFVGVSVGWILGELKKNVEIAREENQLKSSTEALKLMYEIVTTNADIANNVARSLPPTVDPKAIKTRLLESLKAEQALPAQTDEGEDDAAE